MRALSGPDRPTACSPPLSRCSADTRHAVPPECGQGSLVLLSSPRHNRRHPAAAPGASRIGTRCAKQDVITLKVPARPLNREVSVAMATTTTFPTPTSKASVYGTIRRPASRQRTLRKSTSLGAGVATTSTPNLNSLFNSQSRAPPVPPVPRSSLARKGSLATLTQSSLASIPDVSESYAVETVLKDSAMPPLTPGKPAAEDLAVGDIVDVPGGMQGTVRFVGSVQGKKGVFAGVELLPDFAPRGKNNGDVDGCAFSPLFLSLLTALRHLLVTFCLWGTNLSSFVLASRTSTRPSQAQAYSSPRRRRFGANDPLPSPPPDFRTA